MVDVKIVPYDEKYHRGKLYELYLEYGMWNKNVNYLNYGIDVERIVGGTVEEVCARVFPVFTSLKPPEGIILILEVDGKTAGLGRLSMLEEDIAEINNMFIDSEFRGYGYGKELLKQLEEKAKEFGYSTLRLDTGAHNEVAQHIYGKAGFKEREHYDSSAYGRISTNETEDGRKYYENKIYMEKKL